MLLFWDRDSADDRAVRRAVRAVDRWNGEVVVRVAPARKVSRYGRITRGADVSQSPTTLVIDRNLKVTSLVGYVDTRTIDQAVLDALRNSGGYLTDPYLAKVNGVCADVGRVSFAVPAPDNSAEFGSYVAGQKRAVRRLQTRFAALKAPKRFAGFRRATMRDHRALASYLADWSAYLGASPSRSRVRSSLTRFESRAAQAGRTGKAYDKRMDAKHVLSCGSNF